MSSMAFSMYLFTRGEGPLKNTQDLFTQAHYFAEEGVKLYHCTQDFSLQVLIAALLDSFCDVRQLKNFWDLTIKLKQPKIWRTNLRVFWWIQEHPWSSETGIQPFEHFHWYHLVPPKILKDRVKVNSMKVQIPLARFHIELGSNHTKVQRYKHQRHHRLLPLLLITHHLQFCFIAIF